jgi:hypothetical protein
LVDLLISINTSGQSFSKNAKQTAPYTGMLINTLTMIVVPLPSTALTGNLSPHPLFDPENIAINKLTEQSSQKIARVCGLDAPVCPADDTSVKQYQLTDPHRGLGYNPSPITQP